MQRAHRRAFVAVLRDEAGDPMPSLTKFRQSWGADYMDAYLNALIEWRIRDRLRTIHRLGGV